MILPIVAYGDIILKKVTSPIENNTDQLQQLIEDMWDTMYNARGVGLAAPQIGKSIRLFIVDTKQIENDDFTNGIQKVFINATIDNYFDEEEDKQEEGCLSIPEINADVERPTKIKITYLDQQFNEQSEIYEGYNARVIQHEYDHIEGVLFTDKITPLKKRLLKRKLEKISKGKISPKYKMSFPNR